MIGVLFLLAPLAWAKTYSIGEAMELMTRSFGDIARFILATCFVCGLGFGVAAIFKFKQHKDNPQQNTIGTALTILSLSVSLVFLPSFYKPLGRMMFGANTPVEKYTKGPSGNYDYEHDEDQLTFT